MKEQDTKIPTGPVELDLFVDATTGQFTEEQEAHAASREGADTPHEENATEPVTSAASAVGDKASAATEGAAETTEGAAETGKGAAETGEAPRKKKKKKKKKHDTEQDKPKGFLDQLQELINDDEGQSVSINVHGLIGGEGLPGFFKRNWLFISIIVLFTCFYVTCRYMMQSAVLEYDKLTEQLIDRRYKNLTLDCDLLEHTLSSRVEKSLKDSTIHSPIDQSYTLKTTE